MAFPPLPPPTRGWCWGRAGRPAVTWGPVPWEENGTTVRVHGWSCPRACGGTWRLSCCPLPLPRLVPISQLPHASLGSRPQVLPILGVPNEYVFCTEMPSLLFQLMEPISDVRRPLRCDSTTAARFLKSRLSDAQPCPLPTQKW